MLVGGVRYYDRQNMKNEALFIIMNIRKQEFEIL